MLNIGGCAAFLHYLENNWNFSLKYFRFKDVFKENQIGEDLDIDMHYITDRALIETANRVQDELKSLYAVCLMMLIFKENIILIDRPFPGLQYLHHLLNRHTSFKMVMDSIPKNTLNELTILIKNIRS
jgi:hypothetical protein